MGALRVLCALVPLAAKPFALACLKVFECIINEIRGGKNGNEN